MLELQELRGILSDWLEVGRSEAKALLDVRWCKCLSPENAGAMVEVLPLCF